MNFSAGNFSDYLRKICAHYNDLREQGKDIYHLHDIYKEGKGLIAYGDTVISNTYLFLLEDDSERLFSENGLKEIITFSPRDKSRLESIFGIEKSQIIIERRPVFESSARIPNANYLGVYVHTEDLTLSQIKYLISKNKVSVSSDTYIFSPPPL